MALLTTPPPPVQPQDFSKWLLPTYAPADFLPERAQGSTVYDAEGRDYIDLAGGIGVTALGHAHPEILAALQQQAQKIWHLSNYFTHKPALTLARALCERTFAERVFFCNSGTEGNETAIKMARRWHHTQGRPDQNRLMAFTGAFHGRSMMAIALGGQQKYREGYAPIPEGIVRAPFNDLDSTVRLLDKSVAAVIVEPVQGEHGVHPAQREFLAGLREACDAHGTLLIFDEVQTGMGRTGTLYAYMNYGVTPDILVSAKALGAGFPIAAVLTRADVAQCMQPGSHGSTYGGNPLACAVAHRSLQLICDALPGVEARSCKLREGLQQLSGNRRLFSEVRVSGLLAGANNVLRFAPALNISDAELEQGLQRLGSVLDEF